VYNGFKGRLGSVDRRLIRSSKMVRIEDSIDISKIKVCKKPKVASVSRWGGEDLVNEEVDKILEATYL
jgi:hypothetical protein